MLNHAEIEGWDIQGRVEQLLSVLSPYELDLVTKQSLWRWYELSGQWTKAEDLLYELAEEGAISAREGEAFYTRLAECEDADLDAGGITREELEEGSRQWQAFMKENAK